MNIETVKNEGNRNIAEWKIEKMFNKVLGIPIKGKSFRRGHEVIVIKKEFSCANKRIFM